MSGICFKIIHCIWRVTDGLPYTDNYWSWIISIYGFITEFELLLWMFQNSHSKKILKTQVDSFSGFQIHMLEIKEHNILGLVFKSNCMREEEHLLAQFKGKCLYNSMGLENYHNLVSTAIALLSLGAMFLFWL